MRAAFRDALLAGHKTCTARPTRRGRPGNTFLAFGARFRMIHVTRVPLADVEARYREEGFDSPEDFRACWLRLHPRRGWDPEQMVWLHAFARVRARHG